ncbi:NAD(+) diphosphatase [Neobittarella massiliensis]|uniref:NAD(+) diphosphatase n=1 Tax=Neobittarella massiliensis (ex Bilen et al. 2018) TaxID=2041842 RepID=A0A8J6IQ05_9FIRM|nr:NAD(+) diphosphatase [Neobittarella massiliensis]MBC3516216.1 NAD(+) diphosphatase [Neobittarella massiliensis]
MLQDIYPHVFCNDFVRRDPVPGDIALFFPAPDQVLLKSGENGLTLPTFADFSPVAAQGADHLFDIDDQGVYLLAKPGVYSGALSACSTLQFRTLQPGHLAFAGITAGQLYRWKHSHRFCGSCGSPMRGGDWERCMVCPNCHQVEYPKISPAVITAITDGDRLLMVKNDRSSYPNWALVAGFVEFGETFEQTVAREAREEVGLSVKDIRYIGSQPWPFSETEMVGFVAHLDGPDVITLQEEELTDARWFARADIPPSTSDISIGNRLIELFRAGELD